jgi:SAM-dependent methyltransferase
MCGGQKLQRVLQLEPTPIGDAYVTAEHLDEVQQSYPIDLHLCLDCGLSQLLDIVAPELLYRDYIYLTSSSLGLAEHFETYAGNMVTKFAPDNGNLVVDIGSNDGTLLRCFRDHGMRVLGVDPAEETAAQATRDGVETLPEFFTAQLAERICSAHGTATFVTANNVFANIDDLEPVIDGIRIVLAEDGVFSFESFYLADVVQNMVFDFIYHEHLSAFSVKPVQAFFASRGLELFDLQHVPTKGGSIRYFVQRAGATSAVAPVVAEYVAREESMGLYRPDMFLEFSKTIDSLRTQTVDLLDQYRGQGKKIAGFGASITGTTLIYHFGLCEYLDYLVDDNPAKQGRFSPGLHLPVYPGEALLERQPDCVIILAWRFVDPIVDRYRAYLDQGGRFLVPVPEVRLI